MHSNSSIDRNESKSIKCPNCDGFNNYLSKKQRWCGECHSFITDIADKNKSKCMQHSMDAKFVDGANKKSPRTMSG